MANDAVVTPFGWLIWVWRLRNRVSLCYHKWKSRHMPIEVRGQDGIKWQASNRPAGEFHKRIQNDSDKVKIIDMWVDVAVVNWIGRRRTVTTWCLEVDGKDFEGLELEKKQITEWLYLKIKSQGDMSSNFPQKSATVYGLV